MLRMLEDPGVVLARHDARGPDPGDPRDQPRHHLPRRCARQRPRGVAVDIQQEYLTRALRYAESQGLPDQEMRALEMWQHCMEAIEKDPLSLDRECDWVIKHHLVEAYSRAPQLRSPHPKIAMLDLQYHDVSRERGIFYRSRPEVRWSGSSPTRRSAIATEQAPADDRARLRGEFIRKAKERRRDFTVDWVHLKLNDQTQRTVLLKDPFKAYDERVERLIEAM
jgi:proteasome accessory factor A